jgi:hypothetical protein
MQFITKDGDVEEGVPLTAEQVALRELLKEWFHLETCGGSFHGKYDLKPDLCAKFANFFISNFALELREGVSLVGLIANHPSKPRPAKPRIEQATKSPVDFDPPTPAEPVAF